MVIVLIIVQCVPPEIVFGFFLASYVVVCARTRVCLVYMSLYVGEDVVLPVDPSLSSTIVATLPSLTANQDLSTTPTCG